MKPKPKRGYSRAFTPGDGAGHNYLLDRVPAELWQAVKQQATRDGLSVRAFILTALAQRTGSAVSQ